MLETSLISSGVWREVNDLPVQRLSQTDMGVQILLFLVTCTKPWKTTKWRVNLQNVGKFFRSVKQLRIVNKAKREALLILFVALIDFFKNTTVFSRSE